MTSTNECLMERTKLSEQMQFSIKTFILRERKKKKDEFFANEQKIKEEIVIDFFF